MHVTWDSLGPQQGKNKAATAPYSYARNAGPPHALFASCHDSPSLPHRGRARSSFSPTSLSGLLVLLFPCPGSLWFQLFSLLLPPQRHRMLLPGCSPSTHPAPGHPSLAHAAVAPRPHHLAANHPLMSMLVLRCSQPRILSKLGWAPRYPNELPGGSSGDPPSFSRDHGLGPLSDTTGSALPFPPYHHLQLGSQSCCSHALYSGSRIPGPDLSDVLSTETERQNFWLLRQKRPGHAKPSSLSESHISLPSVQFAPPPGSLPEYSKSNSPGSAWSLWRSLKPTNGSVTCVHLLHLYKTFINRQYDAIMHSLNIQQMVSDALLCAEHCAWC